MDRHPLALLETLVNIDSGSGDTEGLSRVAEVIRCYTENWPWAFEQRTASDGSRHYYLRHGQGRRILLIAHLDTVFPKGTVAERPFSVVGDLAHGPGVSDCKSGVVTILAALENLKGQEWPGLEIGCLFNTDEEISSPGSREIIAELTRDAAMVLVAEPAEGEHLTVARKGIGRFTLTVTGKAAHSGSNFKDGHNAIWELAQRIVEIQNLSDPDRGVTFNVGAVRGGSRPNIIPDWAEAQIDLRIKTGIQVKEALAALREVTSRTTVVGTVNRLEGGISRPPLESTAANIELFKEFQRIGRELGMSLGMLESGGGSDANLAAQSGVPTLDGLGPVGGGHHSAREYLEIPSLYLRIRLLTAFLKRLSG